MKKSGSLLVVFLLSISFVIFSSCEDDPLKEVPKDFLADENFWQTEEDALFAVRGMYGRWTGYNAGFQAISLHQEFAAGRGSWSSISNWDSPLDATHMGRINGNWNDNYIIVNRANNVLANVPEIEDIDEDSRAQFIAEARFMRAWAYFQLVRGWGEVPLRLEPSSGANIHEPRAPEDQIYEQIINDAQAAEVDLPVSVRPKTGRASKAAAKMLLANVHLTRENWDQAATRADEIINMNDEYSLVEVQQPDDFYNIFATAANPEDIFSIHHTSNREDGMVYTLHQSNIPEYNPSPTGWFTTVPVIEENEPTLIAPENWEDGDLRHKFNLYREYENEDGDVVPLPSTSPVLFKKYINTPSGVPTNPRPLYRYTEAFLVYAEAAAMAAGGPTPLALERLNMIKRRAHGHDLNSPSPSDYSAGMSLEAFREAVIRERGHEFILEYRRWWDLKRLGRVEEAVEAATGQDFHESRLWWPIPQEEIDNNEEISQADQNPGY